MSDRPSTRPEPAPTRPDLRLPARAAVGALRGYWYQMLYTVERWLDLDERDLLFVEGNEDIDRIGTIDGLERLDCRIFEEQVKFRSSRLDSSTVEPQVFHFLRAFAENHRHRRAFRGILRSNATVAARPRKPFLRWVAAHDVTAENIRDELEKRVPEEAKDALRYVLDNQLLDLFMQSVEWATAAPGPDNLERSLRERR